MAEHSTRDRAPQTFERRSRLTTRAEYARVFKRARVDQDRLFRILSRPNDLPHSRLGMAVSTKVDKHAVGRNRIKRVVRESFRTNQVALAGLDFVVLPSRKAATICKSELRASLERLWRVVLQPRDRKPGPNRRKNS